MQVRCVICVQDTKQSERISREVEHTVGHEFWGNETQEDMSFGEEPYSVAR